MKDLRPVSYCYLIHIPLEFSEQMLHAQQGDYYFRFGVSQSLISRIKSHQRFFKADLNLVDLIVFRGFHAYSFEQHALSMMKNGTIRPERSDIFHESHLDLISQLARSSDYDEHIIETGRISTLRHRGCPYEIIGQHENERVAA